MAYVAFGGKDHLGDLDKGVVREAVGCSVVIIWDNRGMVFTTQARRVYEYS